MAFTAEEYDQNIIEHANWFAAEMSKLQTEWVRRISIEIEAAKEAKIPDHIIAASAQNGLKMLETAAEELRN